MERVIFMTNTNVTNLRKTLFSCLE